MIKLHWLVKIPRRQKSLPHNNIVHDCIVQLHFQGFSVPIIDNNPNKR